jgi:hypothetical protein
LCGSADPIVRDELSICHADPRADYTSKPTFNM